MFVRARAAVTAIDRSTFGSRLLYDSVVISRRWEKQLPKPSSALRRRQPPPTGPHYNNGRTSHAPPSAARKPFDSSSRRRHSRRRRRRRRSNRPTGQKCERGQEQLLYYTDSVLFARRFISDCAGSRRRGKPTFVVLIIAVIFLVLLFWVVFENLGKHGIIYNKYIIYYIICLCGTQVHV